MSAQSIQQKSTARYALFLLMIMAGFAFIDKQLVVLLQEEIKADLNLTDTQIGFITGLAFSIFFVMFSIPVGHLADRFNRKRIIVITMTIWSSITALTGLVQNYVQLIAVRMLMGLGETGVNPPAHSLIADYFPPERRGKAYGVYSLGIYFGIIFGLVIGGLAAEYYGWRVAFYAIGIPSLLFVLLIHFTFKEPKRGLFDKLTDTTERVGLLVVFNTLIRKETFIFLAIAVTLHTFVGMGIGNFSASFLTRVHGMTTAEIGGWMAGTAILGGVSGTYLGGFFSDRLGKKDRRWYLWLPALTTLINIPFLFTYIFIENKILLFTLDVINVFFFSCYLAPTFTVLQDLVSTKMRAIASAIIGIIVNVLGTGLGALTVGAISDRLEPIYGDMSLRWAFFYVLFIEIFVVLAFIRAAKFYQNDTEVSDE